MNFLRCICVGLRTKFNNYRYAVKKKVKLTITRKYSTQISTGWHIFIPRVAELVAGYCIVADANCILSTM
jgi:hypothetical protein